MAVETFSRSLWSSLSPPGLATAPLAGDIEADVLVVGAGFLGLSTALHLAIDGARVVLLEATEAGFGASGRNTGFVVPSLRMSFDPTTLEARLGADRGERLMRLVTGSGTGLFDLVRRFAIECSAEQTGWMQPAHTAALAHLLERRVRERQARGSTATMLDAAETARRIGTDGYHGALLDPTGGQINPLAYARGLARAGIANGVSLHERTAVTSIEPEGRQWRARTAGGSVLAAKVLFTTNALIGRLLPPLADSIVPARVYQIATEPLSPELQSAIVPGRTPVADTRRHTFAVRWSPDGRLVTGGLVLPGPNALGRAGGIFGRRLARFFPTLGKVKPAFTWSGVIAATMDSLPRFLSLAPGLDAAIGCNGRGVALTTALGGEIAALYAGRLTLDEFPLAHLPPEPVPGRRLAQIGPHLWLPWSNLRDRLEGGR